MVPNVAVKIHCPSCGRYFYVDGEPVRGLFNVSTTIEADWQEMSDLRRQHLQTRWFWQCPHGCEGRLKYYTAELLNA